MSNLKTVICKYCNKDVETVKIRANCPYCFNPLSESAFKREKKENKRL